jgi:ABC-type antimicrobial peptide transport system permease subunit
MAAGALAGVASGTYLARFMRSLLYEIVPLDLWSLLLPLGALFVTAIVAALMPALRAVRVDPVVALRFE